MCNHDTLQAVITSNPHGWASSSENSFFIFDSNRMQTLIGKIYQCTICKEEIIIPTAFILKR